MIKIFAARTQKIKKGLAVARLPLLSLVISFSDFASWIYGLNLVR